MMEFIDLKAQFAVVETAVRARMDAVLAHGRFIMGPEIAELEERLARMAGARHCLTCASGSTALDLILMGWGLGPGDAVFTTPLTFVATAESIARTGATPVFVDIRREDYLINAEKLERAVIAVSAKDASVHPLPVCAREKGLRPRAVIAVDLFGHPADYAAILKLADRHGLLVLEDAAQSFGGSYRGSPVCGCGCHAAATSFFPAKPLGCYGDGGAVFTDDTALAERMDSLRYHGRKDAANKNDNVRLGMNGRLDTLQAAVLLAKLDIFDEELAKRRQAALRYTALLQDAPGLTPPAPPVHGVSTWAQYTVTLPAGIDRAKVMARMNDAGVPTMINYPKALHVQGAFAYLGYSPGDFPVAQDVTARVLSLPMHPYLEPDTQERIAGLLKNCL